MKYGVVILVAILMANVALASSHHRHKKKKPKPSATPTQKVELPPLTPASLMWIWQ